MKKKLLSIFLSVAIIFASFPLATVSAAAAIANNEQQIEYVGGWNPPEYEKDGTLYKDRIAVSKTISPTEDENFFDINLKVVAKPRVIDQSVDVVVVMDISNTMNYTHDGLGPNDSGYDASQSRLLDAKSAVNTFVDQFATNQKISQDRRFSLVTFNSYANVTIPMTTLNTSDTAEAIKKQVNAIKAPTENRVRFTNIEGGLQLAQNILTKESDAKYKYIIFLTDGFPTTYIEGDRTSTTSLSGYDTYMTGTYNANKINQDGYFADSIRKKLCLYGVNYSDKAADKADDVAANIKKAGINIFSIGVDVGVQDIDNYLSYVANTNFTTIDRRSTTYVIGNTAESYRAWLENSIAGGTQLDKIDGHNYANGDSSEELTTAFENILKDMELLPAETMEEAYTLDPMSDYVEFMNFYNAAGESEATLINSKTGAEVAVFDDETETIKWWLKKTEGSVKDEHGNFILSITYKVRLENEVEGFNPSTALLTNDTTTFYFRTVDTDTGTPIYGDNSIDYDIPQVEGYLGSFEFTKQDSLTAAPLEGAEFTLEHHGKSCYVCDGAADIPNAVAVSDSNGKVSFTNIPSGHKYVLKETKTPEGYQPGANHSVTVSYGKTYFNDVEVTQSTPVVVENDKIKRLEVILTAQKTMEGRELKADEFTFVLEGINEHGAVFHEKETNGANGNVTFEKIIFDKVGTYKFKVYEEKGKDTTIIYDDTVYEVEFTVTLNDTRDEYLLTTKINGEDVDNDTTPTPLAFTNKERREAEVVLNAEKTMDNAEPEDDAFEFELYDADGNVLQTKKNTGSAVTFDALSYKSEGVYTYTIKEVHGGDEGIYYDHDVYTATVTVTAPENSESFAAEVAYSLGETPVDKVLFKNKTRGTATLKLTADKLMDGKAPEKGEFTFELRDEQKNVLQTVTNDATGAIAFDTLSFDKTGFYTYTINEVKGDKEEIVYDKNIYEVYVVVEAHHNNENYIVYVTVATNTENKYEIIDIGYGPTVEISTVEFENTTRGNAEVNLTAEKTMDGNAPAAGETFTFELKNAQGEVVQSVTNNGKAVKFDTLTFAKSGVYNYTISEVKGNAENVIYDTATYDVTITVSAPETNGAYQAVTTITKNGTAYTGTPLFENKTRGNAEVNLTAEKTMDGNTPAAGETFTFELKNAQGEVVQSVTNNGKAVKFDTLTFAKSGVYNYTISEVKGNAENVIYDTATYDVTITVSAPETNGAYQAVTTITKNGTAYTGTPLFENKTRGNAEVNLTAEKTMDGNTPAAGETFTFELKNAQGEVVQTVTNNGKAVKFDTLTFAKSGVYNYTISEVKGNAENVIYDTATYDVTITVSVPETNGAYQAVTTITKNGTAYTGTPLFENKTRGNAEVNLTAEKTMDGNAPAAGETFTFELKNAQGEVVQTVTNNGKAVKFDTLTFAKSGVYNYTISEVKGNAENVIYDTATYDVTITVSVPETNGAYQAVTTITKNGSAYTGTPLFENKTRKAATAEIKAEKLMNGVTPAQNEVFTFMLLNADGNPLQKVTNNSGEVVFDKLTYTNTGVYTYFVKELKGDNTSIIYDEAVHMIEIYVTAPEDIDTYHVKAVVNNEIEFSGTDVKIGGLKFRNNTRENAKVNLIAEKTIDSKTPAEDKIFTFELKNAQGEVIQTVTNNGKEVNFGTLAFTREGVYTYTINEIIGTDDKVIYDTAVYEVIITVTAPKTNGKFEAIVNITKDGKAYTGTPLFENKTVEETTVPTTEPTVPTTEPTAPTTEPTAPTTEPTVPTTEPTVPTTEPTAPTTEPTAPTTEPTVPTAEPTVPTTEPTAPTTEPTAPTTEPTAPTTEPTAPTTEPTAPTTEPTAPTTEPTVPTTEPTAPTTEPTTPTPNPTEPTKPTTPNTDTPKTGQDSALVLWIALLFVSGTVLYEASVFNKKKKDD